MEVVDSFFCNLNIYFSLLVYNGDPPLEYIKQLEAFDYPVVLVEHLRELEALEHHYRMFVVDVQQLNELAFIKRNNFEQYNVVFCYDRDAFDGFCRFLKDKKPSCVEKMYVTKISL